MANLFQPSLVRATDSSGNPISGAKLKFYTTGTTTAATWYTDQAETTAGTNPLVADANGIFAPAFLDEDVTYRIQLTDASDVVIWDVDPVRGYDIAAIASTASAAADNATAAALAATTGDLNTALETMSAILNSCGCNAPIVRVEADGWQALVTNPTDLALTDLVVVRRGYDITGTANWHADTLKLAKRVREAYPNEDTFTTDKQALSDYVYSTDEIYGATNNSTQTSPKPIAQWVVNDRDRITDGNCTWEIRPFHRDARPDSSGVGRQVACVKVRANDGTTQTAWQTVSTTAQSTYYDDANPPEVYTGTLDVSGLADGTIWLEAEVYPWFGNSSSVLKSEDNYAASVSFREFTRRFYRKDASATQYVAGASTGNDSTGVTSTTAATAEATPCLTLAGALKEGHDTLGATAGALDVLEIRVMDTITGGTVPFTGSYKQDVSAVRVTRGTGVTRANAKVQFGSEFKPDFDSHAAPVTEGALIFEDMSIQFTAICTITGDAGAALHVIFRDCNIDMGGFATPIRTGGNTHVSYYGCTFTNMPASSNNPLGFTTAGEVRIARGCTVDMNAQTMEGWLTIGCDITDSKGQGYSDPTRGVMFYNNRYLSPTGSNSAIIFESTGTTTQTLGPIAVVQNLVEWTSATASPGIRIAADGDEGSTVHSVVHHNTIAGADTAGRLNVWYDEDATVQTDHDLVSFKGNLVPSVNTKGDIFLSNAARVGNFPFHHGVGCAGNYAIDDNADSGSLSFGQAYAGIGSTINAGSPSFTSNQATTGTSGSYVAGAGGGTYTLQSGSAAEDLLAAPVLAFDITGASRGTGTQDAGAYA